eukprot:1356959-Amorphochlora_amoeboformis.AAC.2
MAASDFRSGLNLTPQGGHVGSFAEKRIPELYNSTLSEKSPIEKLQTSRRTLMAGENYLYESVEAVKKEIREKKARYMDIRAQRYRLTILHTLYSRILLKRREEVQKKIMRGTQLVKNLQKSIKELRNTIIDLKIEKQELKGSIDHLKARVERRKRNIHSRKEQVNNTIKQYNEKK